jgi:hypothetical protein
VDASPSDGHVVRRGAIAHRNDQQGKRIFGGQLRQLSTGKRAF